MSGNQDGNENTLAITIAAVASAAILCSGAVAYRFCYRTKDGALGALDSSEPEFQEAEMNVSGVTMEGDTQEVPLTKILTPAETWRKANLFFPGWVGFFPHVTRDIGTHEGIRYALHRKLGAKLSELCSTYDKDRSEVARVEQLMHRENGADLCIALGMDEGLVRLRFEVIHNFETALGLKIPTGKTHVLDSIQHLIDTLHVHNPFGGVSDMTGNIIDQYRGKDWLSYLGVDWPKTEIVEKVEFIEHVVKHAVDIRNDFYVHGTTARDLMCIFEDNGMLEKSQSTHKMPHDFGDGFYCFENEIRWALSFAVGRCWPVGIDENKLPIIISCNPGVVLFPKPMHALIRNHRFEVGPNQKDFDEKALKGMLVNDADFTEFVEAREKWKNNRELRYWKDFVKLSLCYQEVPAQTWRDKVVYGLMHDCREGKKPVGLRAPIPDVDGFIQFCFRNPKYLGTDRLFIEFNMDWSNWITLTPTTPMEPKSEDPLSGQNMAKQAQEDITKEFLE